MAVEAFLNILCIENSRADFLAIEHSLRRGGLTARLTRVADREQLDEALGRAPWHLVLSDYGMPGLDFLEIFSLLRGSLDRVPVILVAGTLGEERAVELLQLGVCDFVAKDRLVRLAPAVERCLRDVSDRADRERAEKERDEFEERLSQAQKLEAVGRLACGVAHDFNNMLGVILGYAELALALVEPSSPLHGNLLEIYKAGRRSTGLTRQLLSFSRKQAVEPAVVCLNDTIAEQRKMLDRLIGEDVSVRFLPAAALWNLKIDPSQLDQLLANLAVNARDAINGVGSITIETANVTLDEQHPRRVAGAPAGDYVLLSFSDTGTGMAEETLQQIFEPFFTTKPEGRGTGLGLSTVYAIVSQNGGLIEVESKPGDGTRFEIYLPRFRGEAAQAAESVQGTAPGGAETVLVAEDEGQILNLAKVVLERQGYRVLAAANPEQACALSETFGGPIHLLLTDVVMPGMTGRELQARVERDRPSIRTLFMSGYTADVLANRGVFANDRHFLPKPFTAHTLARKVRAALDCTAG